MVKGTAALIVVVGLFSSGDVWGQAPDIWAASHCRTALVYAEWDVGQR
jgi:hypothetical protein